MCVRSIQYLVHTFISIENKNLIYFVPCVDFISSSNNHQRSNYCRMALSKSDSIGSFKFLLLRYKLIMFEVFDTCVYF